MDKRLARFKDCDSRFYPYLEKVLERLPGEAKENLLNNTDLQIIADENLLDMCVLWCEFDYPVKNLVYLNMKVLMEPEHQLVYTLAHELAHYVSGEGETEQAERKVEDLLNAWGFEKEIEAVRYDRAIAGSQAYQTGYAWAKKQSEDYLVQHFGLYFDQWNEKGLKTMSREQFDKLQSQAGATAILGDMARTKKQDYGESKEDTIASTLPRDEAIIAGIMAAVKEVKFQDLYGTRGCTVRDK
ncbi:MAG: hypothetical protein JRF50_11810 [Deltaproteobacteria bacterium]|nr:hypothetical protein [Deltaproteobacteria bacterium]